MIARSSFLSQDYKIENADKNSQNNQVISNIQTGENTNIHLENIEAEKPKDVVNYSVKQLPIFANEKDDKEEAIKQSKSIKTALKMNQISYIRKQSKIGFFSKISYIKENSNLISDNFSLLQENENFFNGAQKEDANVIYNNLNNFDITNQNSLNSSAVKKSQSQNVSVEAMNINTSVQNNLQNIKLNNISIVSKLNISTNNINIDKETTGYKETQSNSCIKKDPAVNHKHSTSTIVSNKNDNSIIKKITPKKISHIPEKVENTIERKLTKQTISSENTNLSSHRKEYDISKNAQKLRQFEMLLKTNAFGKAALNNTKRNKENITPYPLTGNQSNNKEKKKISLNKYKYLFSDVPQNQIKKSFNDRLSQFGTNISTEHNIIKEDSIVEFARMKKKFVTQNNSQYSNLFI